jgi:hypothetical protein
MFRSLYATVAVAALAPAVAVAGSGTQSGTGSNGLSWTATSRIVGQNSTATVAAGGNPAYLATNARGYSGVVGLLMTYSDGSQFVCSGALTAGNRIVTAAHCVSNGYQNGPGGKAADLVRTQAFFYDGVSSGDDPYFYNSPPGVTAIDIAGYNVNTGYTGEVIDQNDIAVLTLASAAPDYAQAYALYGGGDLTGSTFNVAGLGTRSLTGGVDGTTGPGAGAGVGRRRQGDNIYDYSWGNAAFGGFFTDRDASGENFFGTAEVEFSFISDFDRLGSGANNQACFVAQAVAGAAGLQFCTQAVGPLEVSIAGGDSGGPGFINGQLASVNSYGLSFGTSFGDSKSGLQSSFGELNGFVPIFLHTGFIANVPEPSTWALLILGFGVAGAAMRRKIKVQARYAF